MGQNKQKKKGKPIPTNGIIHENGKTYMWCGAVKVEIRFLKLEESRRD